MDRCSGQSDPLLFIIGNKGDLGEQRQVAYGEGATKALMHNAKFYEITAKDPVLIDEMLLDLAKTVHNRKTNRFEEAHDAVERLIPLQSSNPGISLHHHCCNMA
ncbi:unnamed protein product [Anisakis simplex]|uniref:Uncharacterized protein n=1 Tax=Anisakis simplex TaxID=6269 RepID=A0A3P6P230_ANISI|nr:unnamed protein product [Anisakis simplex]